MAKYWTVFDLPPNAMNSTSTGDARRRRCTVRASVRQFHSPDADLDTYSPDDPEDVGLLVQIMVGPEGKPGEESFDVVVCTPRWLGRWVQEDGPLIGHHLVVIESWDAARVQLLLTSAIESKEAPTWKELAGQIGQIGKWEFQDYVPHVEDSNATDMGL